MPRRRRPRCKVKPLIALHQEPGESDGSQVDQIESKSDDTDVSIAAHEVTSIVISGGNDWDYKLFPELHNQLSCMPTFCDIFGQHSDVIFQEHMPDDYFKSGNQVSHIFGLSGLVENLRSTCNNVNTVQLAIGEDLTTFGLDLASQGDIYVHFNGPFTQQPAGRSSANCALELGMRAMRDAMDKYPTRPPIWDSFVPETRNLGLLLSVPKLTQQSNEKSA